MGKQSTKIVSFVTKAEKRFTGDSRRSFEWHASLLSGNGATPMTDAEWLASSLPHVEAWRARAKPRSSEGTLVGAQELGASLRARLHNLDVDVPGTEQLGANAGAASLSGNDSAAASRPSPTATAAPAALLERVLSDREWTDQEKALMRGLLNAAGSDLMGNDER